MNNKLTEIMSFAVLTESIITYFKEFFVYGDFSFSMLFSIILGVIIAVEPLEAEYIKLMFGKTVKDSMGSYQIARFLNEKGLRTHDGSKFQSNTVNRILKNKMYCGYLSSGNVTSDFIEELKIIDENIFDTARNIVTQRLDKNNVKRTIALNNKSFKRIRV